MEDLSRMLPIILEKHPSLLTLVLHIGGNDVWQSEVLRRNLTELLTSLKSKGPRIIMSGPLPTHGMGDMKFSKHKHLHTWLSSFCSSNALAYVSNFPLYTTHPELMRDGLHLNREGTTLLATNISKTLDA